VSRNFGIPERQRLPKVELLSPWAKDILAAALLIGFFGVVVSWLSVEFPNGLADVRIELVSSNH
jgi:hypothetical protein